MEIVKMFWCMAIFVGLYLAVSAYFDRPVVEVSVDTGKCVHAYGPMGSMSCAEAMKGVYEKVVVDPNHGSAKK